MTDYRKILASELEQNLRGNAVSFSGTVLDVGCGDGRYFETLRNLGAQVLHGVDPEIQPEAEQAKYGHADDLFYGTVEGLAQLNPAAYDHIAIFKLSLGGPSSQNAITQAKSLAALLKENGKVTITFTHKDEAEGWQPVLDYFFKGHMRPIIDASTICFHPSPAPGLIPKLKESISAHAQRETGEYLFTGKPKENWQDLPVPTAKQIKPMYTQSDDLETYTVKLSERILGDQQRRIKLPPSLQTLVGCLGDIPDYSHFFCAAPGDNHQRKIPPLKLYIGEAAEELLEQIAKAGLGNKGYFCIYDVDLALDKDPSSLREILAKLSQIPSQEE